MNLQILINFIKANLSPDLLHKKYLTQARGNYLAGHCYVASEALYHLFKESMLLKPMHLRHENCSHWYLMHDNTVIDITEKQFKTPVPYHKGRGRGFLTKKPSKRAATLISKVRNDLKAKGIPFAGERA